MYQKKLLIALFCLLALLAISQVARATTIISASLDKNTYLAGQTGYISVTVYNDKSDKIRVIELSATINYYYTDGTVYLQKFFTGATLPDEILEGQTKIYRIPISLPTNIAHGYTNPTVEARTELWEPERERWMSSDRETYQLKLYIESPYKQLYESSQQQLQSTEQQLQSTQQQLQEQKAVNENLTNIMNLLAATTIVFASAATGFFVLLTRRPRPIAQS